jgi:hypothetical protein
MVTVPILVFPDWAKEFHVHVYASTIGLGEILTKQGEGDIDHPIALASRNLLDSEQKYNTTKREGLAMVYHFHKYIHYFFGEFLDKDL